TPVLAAAVESGRTARQPCSWCSVRERSNDFEVLVEDPASTPGGLRRQPFVTIGIAHIGDPTVARTLLDHQRRAVTLRRCDRSSATDSKHRYGREDRDSASSNSQAHIPSNTTPHPPAPTSTGRRYRTQLQNFSTHGSTSRHQDITTREEARTHETPRVR